MSDQINYVFIHGAGGTESKWREIKPYFKDKQATYLNLPGRKDKKEITVQTIEDYAKEVAKEITDETILVGHSMGGLIGLEVAKNNPLIKGLVLVASSYELPVHPSILDSFAKGEFPEFLFKASYTKEISTELLNQEEAEKTNIPSEITHQDFVACNTYQAGKETLQSLQIPVLALFGSEDKLLGKDTEENLIEANPQIQINKITGEKHYLILESPKQVSDIIRSFSENC